MQMQPNGAGGRLGSQRDATVADSSSLKSGPQVAKDACFLRNLKCQNQQQAVSCTICALTRAFFAAPVVISLPSLQPCLSLPPGPTILCRCPHHSIMDPKSFMGCPGEIQLVMLDFLSFDDLKRLSLVSKPAHNLAEPRLYSHVVLSWTSRAPRLVPLLRSILHKPSLGHSVHSLRLDGVCRSKGWTLKDCEPPPLSVSALPTTLAVDHIRSTGITDADGWIKELEQGALDAVIALLVSMLPNLETLHLGPDYTIRSFRLGMVFRSALQVNGDNGNEQLPSFQCLRGVRFSGKSREWLHRESNNTADVLPLFRLPAVDWLSVSIDNPKSWPFEISASNVTSLELFRLRERWLGDLLAPLTSLKKLKWRCDYWTKLDNDANQDFIDLDITVKALQHLSGTLIDLAIEIESNPDWHIGEFDPPEYELRGSLRGLETLHHVKNLALPWNSLTGQTPDTTASNLVVMAQVLPAGIEVLELTGDVMEYDRYGWEDEILLEIIKAWLENRGVRSLLSKLRHIVLPIVLNSCVWQDVKIEGSSRFTACGWSERS